jgi:hypothetical protein
MKSQKHVSIVSADSNREFFTNHGLHMNNRGKEIIAKIIADTSSAIFCKDNMIPSLFTGRIIMMTISTME